MDEIAPVTALRPVAGNAGVGFPDGFLWGAATSSHQVEGGNCWNDWWELEQSGRLPYRSAEACRHYELYESDFDLAKSLGHNAHRLSIEWSRIEPRQGIWNEDELDHYAAVIAALRRRNIEPIITLHHFTNPAWFARRGGWTRSDSVALFARYVDVVAARLANNVKFWLTINEPTVYVKHAYVACDWPPCGRRSWWKAARALRNLCRAHTVAYLILHRHRPDAMVGLAHSATYVVACNPQSVADRFAARSRSFTLNELVFRLLGRPPREALDFIGINYYAREIVRWRPTLGTALIFGVECTADHHEAARTFTTLGWEIFAPGLRQVLRRFGSYGLPLMVTENGIATNDEELRARYLEAHVAAVDDAIRDGAAVLGYLYWTLMDNYEWTSGREARFGLAAVDFQTQERTLRPAARIFKALCSATVRANRVHSD
jgi:beta-glucosidase